MTINAVKHAWSTEVENAKQHMHANGGKPGIARMEQLAEKSGRQILEAMISGKLPYPHMNHTLDIHLMEVGDGRAVFQGEPAIKYFNPMGTVHGGWYATMLDSTLGCAVQSKLPAGRSYTTAELSINIVRPANHKTGPLRAVATVIHWGRQMATAEARLVGPDDKLYAHATTTCFIFDLIAANAKG